MAAHSIGQSGTFVMNTSHSDLSSEMVALLSKKIVGQPGALERITPYIQMHQAGLTPEGRPIGVFLLLGPTGTGKTRTVEVLAELLHGSHQRYLRIDCGEFQLDHEVSKLIGSPPGYLGHKETVPILSRERLSEATSPACDVSLVLFDEIEKAAPAMTQMLLGVLDKATLKLGDNTSVNFEKSLIFLTSNLGAREMMRELTPTFGFEGMTPRDREETFDKLESIALGAVRRKFSPEFVNRIDAVVTYQPLTSESLGQILEHQISELQNHVNSRLGSRCFDIEIDEPAKEFLLRRGTSVEYGARELKRTVHRFLTQPLATMVAESRIAPGSRVLVGIEKDAPKLTIKTTPRTITTAAPLRRPQILIVDDNLDLLKFMKGVMKRSEWDIFTADTAEQAVEICDTNGIDVVLMDYVLPDLDGVQLSRQLRDILPSLKIVIMTGGEMSSDGEEICRKCNVPIIQKPFLVEDVLGMIRGCLPVANKIALSAH